MTRSIGITCALLALLLAACDRRTEPFVEGEEPSEPDLSRIFPEGAERSASQIDEVGGAVPTPNGGRGAPPVAAASSNLPIRGTIEVAPELAGRLPANAILFLIARRGSAGPPLAVRRIASPTFPLEFSIGPGDRMIESMPFVGPLNVTARLDSDGNATSRSPGDLQGAAGAPVNPGASGVVVVLDQVL
jgi:cytochrome c-type biogenesis protein CcmH